MILFLLAHLGGWARLAQYYETQATFEGETWNFKSGRMGLVNYSGCRTIGANDEGLYLAVFPVFRLGYPPYLSPGTI